MTAAARRLEPAVVALFAAMTLLPFLGKPFHMDEPVFLAPARQILQDPRRPLDFEFNWYGWTVPMAAINVQPPLMLYVLAAALKLTGGDERAMRLFFLPFDLLSAVSLYLLAARFLKRPLLPVLVLLAAPAYLINMGLLYPEKLSAAFGFFGLYALVRGVEDGEDRWFWGSALSCAAALAAKYSAVFLLAAAGGYCFLRGVPRRRILAYVALCCAGIGGYFLHDLLSGRRAFGAVGATLADAAAHPSARLTHRLRSLLAFAGGCGVITAVWPFWAFRPPLKAALAMGAAAAALFLPVFDFVPIRGIDRAMGASLAFGAGVGLWGIVKAPATPAAALWRPWAVGMVVVLLAYWSIMARLVMFLLPPLVFAAAAELERRFNPDRLGRFYAASLAAVFALSLSLAWVDFRYALTQRELAEYVAGHYAGRRLWLTGHWGLQYYLERLGARELDLGRGGWGQVRSGDVVIVPKNNANILRPDRRIAADVRHIAVPEALPLRLISKTGAQAGFYSNVMGFLPYSISRAPLDEYDLFEVQ